MGIILFSYVFGAFTMSVNFIHVLHLVQVHLTVNVIHNNNILVN